MKPAPWSADNGLAATDSRLRSVDISHLSVAHGLLSADSRPAPADNRRMSSGISPMSADIALVSVAPLPLSPADRPLDVAPIHFHMEVRMAKRFPSLPI